VPITVTKEDFVAYLCEIACACIDVVLWCEYGVLVAKWWHVSTVGISHAVGESIFCHEGWRHRSSQIIL